MPQNRATNPIKTASGRPNAVLPKVDAEEIGDQWEARRWARGFLRLWIASAAIWIGMVGLFALSDSYSQERLELTAWAFIPPTCALAVVLTLVWIWRGFRTKA
jgi:hypothetical protein